MHHLIHKIPNCKPTVVEQTIQIYAGTTDYQRGAGMSKQIRNKFKYDIPIYHRPIISVDEATAYSGIGRTKLYELTTMENCPFVIWVGTRRVIKRKSFVEYLERQYSI